MEAGLGPSFESGLGPSWAFDEWSERRGSIFSHDFEASNGSTGYGDAVPAPRKPWQDRMADLARLVTKLGPDVGDSASGPLIHKYIDAINIILRNPAQESPNRSPERSPVRLQKSPAQRPPAQRPPSPSQASSEPQSSIRSPTQSERERPSSVLELSEDPFHLKVPDWLAAGHQERLKEEKVSTDLKSILEEVTELNQDLHRRHRESLEIRDMFEKRCSGLTQRVAELEDVRDMFEKRCVGLTRSIADLEESKDVSENRCIDLTNTVTELQESHDDSEKRCFSLTQKVTELEQFLDTFEKRCLSLTHTITELEDIRDTFEKRCLSLTQTTAEMEAVSNSFEQRCLGLTRTVTSLEDEVLELKSDLSEDAVELEVMQGIVRGLHDWINVSHQQSRRRRGRADEEMLEGLSAWMRGWKDVEDGFQIRGHTRKTRRDQRKSE